MRNNHALLLALLAALILLAEVGWRRDDLVPLAVPGDVVDERRRKNQVERDAQPDQGPVPTLGSLVIKLAHNPLERDVDRHANDQSDDYPRKCVEAEVDLVLEGNGVPEQGVKALFRFRSANEQSGDGKLKRDHPWIYLPPRKHPSLFKPESLPADKVDVDRFRHAISLLGMILMIVAGSFAVRTILDGDHHRLESLSSLWCGILIGIVATCGTFLAMNPLVKLRDRRQIRSLRTQVFDLENQIGRDPERSTVSPPATTLPGGLPGIEDESRELRAALQQAHVDLSYLRERIERSLREREPTFASRVRSMFRLTSPSPEIVSLAQGLDRRTPNLLPLAVRPKMIRASHRNLHVKRSGPAAPLWPPPSEDMALRALLRKAERVAKPQETQRREPRFLRHLRVLRGERPEPQDS